MVDLFPNIYYISFLYWKVYNYDKYHTLTNILVKFSCKQLKQSMNSRGKLLLDLSAKTKTVETPEKITKPNEPSQSIKYWTKTNK